MCLGPSFIFLVEFPVNRHGQSLLPQGTSWANVTIDGKRITTTGNELIIRTLGAGDEGVYQVNALYLLIDSDCECERQPKSLPFLTLM